MEVWKDIAGYEGLYQVSNFGRIKSLKFNKQNKAKILRPKSNGPYLRVTLWNKKPKEFFVHRLVAAAFVDNSNGYNQVNHKDGVKTNNAVSNLEWVTQSQNALHSAHILRKSPGDWSSKRVRCTETGQVFSSQTQAAEICHTSQGAIGNAARKNRPRAGGYHWEFVE